MDVLTKYDAAIVGASLAGSAAAISLAREGLKVAIFDKASFPRHKPCGEGLSHLAFPLLEDLGICSANLHSEENRFFGFQFISQDVTKLIHKNFVARSRQLRGCGISRRDLDNSLIARAVTFDNVSLFIEEGVRGIRRDDTHWIVASSRRTVRARFLILAQGAQGTRFLPDLVCPSRGTSQRLGYSMMARKVAGRVSPVVSVLPLADGEIYLTPLKDAHFNISLVGTRKFIQSYRDQGVVVDLLKRHLGIDLEIVWRGAGAAYFEVAMKSHHPELFLVGDACESFDPACGLGMSHALISARLASELIIDIAQGRRPASQALRSFHDIHKKIAWRIRLFSRIVRQLFFLYRVFPFLFLLFGERFSGRLLSLIERWSDPTSPLTEL